MVIMAPRSDYVMHPLREMVIHYLTVLDGADGQAADDAWHSLRELGPVALPLLHEEYYSIDDFVKRIAIIQIVSQWRTQESLRFLAACLRDPHPDVWKAALDGVVSIGGPGAHSELQVWRISLPPDQQERCDEAIAQIGEDDS